MDDIALEVVEDYMVDGSFQSYTNTVWSNNSRTEQAVSGGRAQAVGGNRGITSENNEVVVPKVGQPYLLIGWAQSDDGDISIGAKRYEDGNAQVATPINARSYEQNRMVVPAAGRV
ncbi:MAG: hypothetical protein Q4B12_00565 [Bowdeniella nasicola]|nr:hypothetical protein [Bowdeniella nasicola]